MASTQLPFAQISREVFSQSNWWWLTKIRLKTGVPQREFETSVQIPSQIKLFEKLNNIFSNLCFGTTVAKVVEGGTVCIHHLKYFSWGIWKKLEGSWGGPERRQGNWKKVWVKTQTEKHQQKHCRTQNVQFSVLQWLCIILRFLRLDLRVGKSHKWLFSGTSAIFIYV